MQETTIQTVCSGIGNHEFELKRLNQALIDNDTSVKSTVDHQTTETNKHVKEAAEAVRQELQMRVDTTVQNQGILRSTDMVRMEGLQNNMTQESNRRQQWEQQMTQTMAVVQAGSQSAAAAVSTGTGQTMDLTVLQGSMDVHEQDEGTV